MEPSPNCLVIEERARSIFFSRAALADFSAGARRDSADFDLSALDMGGYGLKSYSDGVRVPQFGKRGVG